MIDKAIILLTGRKIDGKPVSLVQVAGSPLIRRTAIAAHRAGARQVIVVADGHEEDIMSCLESDGIPLRIVSWQQWRSQRAGSGRRALVLLDDRLYDHRLLGALAQVDPGKAQAVIAYNANAPEEDICAGVYDDRLLDELRAADSPQPSESALIALNRRLIRHGGFACLRVEIGQLAAASETGCGFWHLISNREDIAVAEKKLLSYIWKPTDGVHTRFNKRLATPLIKLLLRTRVTPNMVSIFSILVSLASGLCFAQGSYLYALYGALLSYLSAILDHVDGSLARTKLRESSFGCWLDSFCDYIYYLSIGAGITVGLFRQSQNGAYMMMGALMLLGTVLSFIVQSYQRRKYSGANPSEYVLKIHAKLEQGRRNPIFLFARKCYFLARRPVLPIYIFIFTALEMLPFVLFMVTLGANLVWSITLASNALFRSAKDAA